MSDKNKANAEKQKRYRERQKKQGYKQIRGYVDVQAQDCYQKISEITGWTDSEIMSNSLKITFAAYKCGQIKLLNAWLTENMPKEADELKNPNENNNL